MNEQSSYFIKEREGDYGVVTVPIHQRKVNVSSVIEQIAQIKWKCYVIGIKIITDVVGTYVCIVIKN